MYIRRVKIKNYEYHEQKCHHFAKNPVYTGFGHFRLPFWANLGHFWPICIIKI